MNSVVRHSENFKPPMPWKRGPWVEPTSAMVRRYLALWGLTADNYVVMPRRSAKALRRAIFGPRGINEATPGQAGGTLTLELPYGLGELAFSYEPVVHSNERYLSGRVWAALLPARGRA